MNTNEYKKVSFKDSKKKLTNTMRSKKTKQRMRYFQIKTRKNKNNVNNERK